jgi:hypothetical protein
VRKERKKKQQTAGKNAEVRQKREEREERI